jgi:transposase
MQKGAGMTPPATVRVTDPQGVQGTIDTTAWPLDGSRAEVPVSLEGGRQVWVLILLVDTQGLNGYCWPTFSQDLNWLFYNGLFYSRYPMSTRRSVMSLKPHSIQSVPEETARVAHAAFPHGTPYLAFRDALGSMFQDEDFAALFPACGQPGLPPWRLAVVTILQFREQLSDRQAAEAVRARIDWKYLLGLELSDSGFDFSVLSEFRDRLLAGHAEALLLDKLLERCRALGLLKARGQQRTDSTHVLAAIRVMNRLELVAETLRAALNELATIAPAWLQSIVPPEWYERYGQRIEDTRLPREPAKREAYAQTVGEDGLTLLDALDTVGAPSNLRALPSIDTLRRTWHRHYERIPDEAVGNREPPVSRVRFRPHRDLPPAAEGVESPYDTEARYRHKRDTQWTGYMVHVSEICEPTAPHVLTHVHTTTAAVHEAQCTAPIQQALVEKDLPPSEHLVDAAYIDAELLVSSHGDYGITLRGPARPNPNWQANVEGAYTLADFAVDWERQQVHCPQGKAAASWAARVDATGRSYIQVRFRQQDCRACRARALCTQATQAARSLTLQPQAQFEALHAARAWYASEEGQQRYKRRAGGEGTLSQGVRAFGLRYARYRGLAKTHLQHVATAAAINMDRIVAWLDERPRAKTRTSRLAALAPACGIPQDTPAI